MHVAAPLLAVGLLAPAALATGSARVWDQCGGNYWDGPKNCETGSVCVRDSDWYSQCRPTSHAKPTPSGPQPQFRASGSSNGSSGTSPVWSQCGGKGWNGPQSCAPGSTCVRQDDYYSQCKPSGGGGSSSGGSGSSSGGSSSGGGTSGGTAPVWSQCGGIGWGGPKLCASGSSCVRNNDYYSQCIPGGSGSGSSSGSGGQPREQATAQAGGQVNKSFGSKSNPYERATADGVTAAKGPYDYQTALGLSLRFLEVQRSGAIESAPGGNNVAWRKDQLLQDGSDRGYDLAGGHYEAGNRLKISLASGYAIARVAFGCLYYHDVFEQTMFEGKSMMYWCMREVKWGADWLLKTHISKNPTDTWQDSDRFIIQVGKVQRNWGGGNPGDFDCYKRAENIPAQPNCPLSTRKTYIATARKPHADGAAEAAAALALSAALLRDESPDYARRCIRTAHALYDFGNRYPRSRSDTPDRLYTVAFTYNTTTVAANLLWASSVLAFVHKCPEGSGFLCSASEYGHYIDEAYKWWGNETIAERRNEPVANWNNAVYDASFLLTLLTGDGYARSVVRDFVNWYVQADGTMGITHSPKGMRVYSENQWSSLRLSTMSSYIAMLYASLPDAEPEMKKAAACYARSQLGYIFGDTGRSYVVGIGKNYPKQVHHREAACTLEEDAMGLCDRKSPKKENYLWFADRPNPNDVTGAIVGGPRDDDKYIDERNEFHYTEVAIDFNCALTVSLAGMLTAPPSIYTDDCSGLVPNYPW